MAGKTDCRRGQKRVPLNLACWLINDDDVVCYQTFDLSATGICIRSTQQLPEGKIVELQIFMPESSTPLSITAKVVWNRECDDGTMGLIFLEHSRSHLDKLLELAEREAKRRRV